MFFMESMELAQGNYRQYPPALASYEDVVGSSGLFMETLEKLHAAMGTKFMVPVIGGKELDIHRLFIEVTSRGGLEKIIKDRRWKDVTAVFSFPSTATNASFVLRKYYISLLHHYEQIYYFGAKEWIPSTAPSMAIRAQSTLESTGTASEAKALSQKHSGDTVNCLSEGFPVVGIIDGKFDYGYLVTVTAGTEKLKGVLYHTLEHPPSAKVANFSRGSSYDISHVPTMIGTGRRRRKKSEMRRDPTHPKPNRSGYNFFFAEQHARLKSLRTGKDREISRMIGDLWNKLSESEKAVYQERGLKDKARYQSEMEVYRERQKAHSVSAIPIQQRLPGFAVKMEAPGCAPLESLGNESSSSEDKNAADQSTETENSFDAEMDEVTGTSPVNGSIYGTEKNNPMQKSVVRDATVLDNRRHDAVSWHSIGTKPFYEGATDQVDTAAAGSESKLEINMDEE